MSGERQSDGRRVNKHIGHPPAHRHASQTRPRAVTYSRFHRRYAARHLRCHRVHLGVCPPNNALHLLTCRDGRALREVCIAPALWIVQQWVPLYLNRPGHGESILSLTVAGEMKEEFVPGWISSPGDNWIGLLVLTTPPVASSYENRLRWRTSTGGSASMTRNSVVCSPAFPGPLGLICTIWGCEMWVSAS